MTEQNQKQADRSSLFLGVACAALAVLSLLLTRQNLSLKSKLKEALGAPQPGAMKVGDTVPAFDVVDTAGNRTHVAFDGQPKTLLLVFSSTCGACRETIPVWNRLLAGAGSTNVHVVGVQTDFSSHAAADSSMPIPAMAFPIFGAAEPYDEPMSKFPAIPAAAIIDASGTVKAVWVGMPNEAQVSELQRALAG